MSHMGCLQMRDSRGKRVGRCKEWVKVVSDTEVDVRVLAMRHKDKGHIPPERQALKPERVLAYRCCLASCCCYFTIICSLVLCSSAKCAAPSLKRSWLVFFRLAGLNGTSMYTADFLHPEASPGMDFLS